MKRTRRVFRFKLASGEERSVERDFEHTQENCFAVTEDVLRKQATKKIGPVAEALEIRDYTYDDGK